MNTNSPIITTTHTLTMTTDKTRRLRNQHRHNRSRGSSLRSSHLDHRARGHRVPIVTATSGIRGHRVRIVTATSRIRDTSPHPNDSHRQNTPGQEPAPAQAVSRLLAALVTPRPPGKGTPTKTRRVRNQQQHKGSRGSSLRSSHLDHRAKGRRVPIVTATSGIRGRRVPLVTATSGIRDSGGVRDQPAAGRWESRY